MSQSNKLSLFLGMSCKSMANVILHLPDWTMHVKDSTIQRLEQSSEVRRAMQHEAFMMANPIPTHGLGCIYCAHEALSIEAMPEDLTDDEITPERADMIDAWQENIARARNWNLSQQKEKITYTKEYVQWQK